MDKEIISLVERLALNHGCGKNGVFTSLIHNFYIGKNHDLAMFAH
jgi:hypothetical protein